MDGLAQSYSRKPIVFLEYDRNSEHAYNRVDRFLAAWHIDNAGGGASPDTPMTMVESGFMVRDGDCNFRVEYGDMIEAALEREALAVIHAHRDRPDPSSVHISAQITNLADVPLDTAVNEATVHVVLYEGHRALHTGRVIHRTERAFFEKPLASGESRRFYWEFDALRGVNASQLEAAVFADYHPDTRTDRWDMLQGAIASADPLPDLPEPTPTPVPTDTPVPPTPVPPTAMPPTAMPPTAIPEEVEPDNILYLPRTIR